MEDGFVPQLYACVAQAPAIFSTLVVRTAGEPLAMTRAVQRAIWSIDKDQPMWKIRTMEYLVDRSYSNRRYSLVLLASFSLLALVLAALGVYGVIAYTVMQRTQEFGIRAAIGAGPRDLFRLVAAKGAMLIGVGLGCGFAASLAGARYLRSAVYDIDVLDVRTYAGVVILLVGVGLIAIALPARRAMRIDPVSALRQE